MQENDNTNNEHGADWIDFKELKAKIEVSPVLAHFGILKHLEKRGSELVGWCPLGKQHGKADSFTFNVEKKSFQCFACKARGSVLDFIGKYQGVGLRDAGKIAVAIGGIEKKDTTIHGGVEKNTTTIHGGIEKKDTTIDTRPYGKTTLSEGVVSQPDKKRKRGSLPIFTWQQAQELLEKSQLNPDKLLIVDTDNIADLFAFLARAKSTKS